MRITINKIDKIQGICFIVLSLTLMMDLINKENYMWSIIVLAFSMIPAIFVRNVIPLPLKILFPFFNILALSYILFKILFWSQWLLLLRISLALSAIIIIILALLYFYNRTLYVKIFISNMFSLLLIIIIIFNSVRFNVFSNDIRSEFIDGKVREEALLRDEILEVITEYKHKLAQSQNILLHGADKNKINIIRSELILDLVKLSNLTPDNKYTKDINLLINEQQLILINSTSSKLSLRDFNLLINKTDLIRKLYITTTHLKLEQRQ